MPAISPENAQHGKHNLFYPTDEEFEIALADALNEEYRSIVNAGLIVQVDDPQLITYFNRNPNKSVAECRAWAEGRIEIINHALRGIPEEMVRFHTCYSFDAAPRLGDMELKDMLDLILRIRAGAYSFEAANPRHEHEYELWETVKLPEGKILLPGVVAISTVVVEHPDLVKQRLLRFAKSSDARTSSRVPTAGLAPWPAHRIPIRPSPGRSSMRWRRVLGERARFYGSADFAESAATDGTHPCNYGLGNLRIFGENRRCRGQRERRSASPPCRHWPRG